VNNGRRTAEGSPFTGRGGKGAAFHDVEPISNRTEKSSSKKRLGKQQYDRAKKSKYILFLQRRAAKWKGGLVKPKTISGRGRGLGQLVGGAG